MLENGASRGTRISWRRSLRATSAARSIRLLQAPVAMADNVPVLQGTTTIAEGAPEPEATGDIQSSLPYTRICPGAAPVYSLRNACMACGLLGRLTSGSVAITSCAALEIRKCTSRSSCTRQSSRRRPYCAPDAPVMARVILSGPDIYASRAAASLPCKPPKPPLLITTTWVPGAASALTPAMIASRESHTRVGTVELATVAARSQPRLAGAYQYTESAKTTEPGKPSRWAPSFIELERGSTMAISLAVPMRLRRPSRVVAMAVGWWAKSSKMVTPLTSATFSMRRLALIKLHNAAMPSSGTTPTCRAAASTARALATLCWPVSCQSTTPAVLPSKLTSKREPSSLSKRACHWPPSPVVCTGVQQPIWITRLSAGSVVG